MAVKSLSKDDRGISLVEVLVSVAILAIICVPVFSSFRTSSVLNNRAHHTQKLNLRAQEEMETIKSCTVGEYETKVTSSKDEDGNHGTVEYGTVPPEYRTAFPDAALYPDELFCKVTYTQKDVPLAGRKYTVTTVMDPIPYSQYSIAGKGFSQDTNVFGITAVDEIDGLKFPLVAHEINRYEGKNDSGLSAVLGNLLGKRLGDDVTNTTQLLDICQKTKKAVKVTITGSESLGWVRVVCDVSYMVPAEPPHDEINLDYNVYAGKFDLEEEKDKAGNFKGWKRGGNVFIFAKPWQERFGSPASDYNPKENSIEIVNQYEGSHPLNLYLVRGNYQDNSITPPSKWGLNFDQVILTDRKGSRLIYADLSPGQEPLGYRGADEDFQGNFYTNIKGAGLTRQLRNEDLEMAVGRDSPGLRCAQVTVTFTDQKDGGIKAKLTSVKEIR